MNVRTLTASMRAVAVSCQVAAGAFFVPAAFALGGAAGASPQVLTLNVAATGSADTEIDESLGGGRIVRNVTKPTLTVYRAAGDRSKRSGVVIAPGGAFMMLSIDREGEDVARWFAARGVTAFLLKYRLEHTFSNNGLFALQLGWRVFRLQHRSSGDLPTLPGEYDAFVDEQQAIRLVRADASQWDLDPDRIGILGFSAGGIAAIRAGTEYQSDSRPAFVAALYANKPLRRPVPADAPPLFAAIARDDPFFPSGAGDLYAAWKQAGVAAELHVYDAGGHGFGIKPQGKSSDHWIDQLQAWLEARDLMPSPSSVAR